MNSALFTAQTQKKPLEVKQEVQDESSCFFVRSVEAHDSDDEEF